LAESDRQPAFSPGRAASEDRQLLAALVRDAWQAKQERKVYLLTRELTLTPS
jgi:hypothetical protein